MAILYVVEPGNCLKKSQNTITITHNKNVIRSIPIEKIDAVVLFGGTSATSPVIIEFLERGIPFTWISKKHKVYGRLESTKNVNIERQREQFRSADNEEFSLSLSKKFIRAKVHNQAVSINRFNRYKENVRVKDLYDELIQSSKRCIEANSISELMGYEGSASRKYFNGISELINEPFKFKGRSKQPPRDPFNSLISFGYTLLLYEIYTTIVCKGLHPYFGFLHQIKRGHPALASDLIEEYRSVIVDALVMNLLNKGTIKNEDFNTGRNGGVYLNDDKSKIFIRKFEEKMNVENSYLDSVENKVSYRRNFEIQVNSLVKAIENKNPDMYEEIIIK